MDPERFPCICLDGEFKSKEIEGDKICGGWMLSRVMVTAVKKYECG